MDFNFSLKDPKNRLILVIIIVTIIAVAGIAYSSTHGAGLYNSRHPS